MERDDRTRKSKTLSYVLRHAPESVGLTLDRGGYVAVDTLLAALSAHGKALTREEVEEIVRLDAKGRYQLAEGRIRAVQGHSTDQVELEFEERSPPPLLFHGTSSAVKAPILKEGLKPQGRHLVHLSAELETAKAVGRRHVKRGEQLVVFGVDTAALGARGTRFFIARNGVWLVESAPGDCLQVIFEG